MIPMGNAKCGCPKFLIEPPLSPNGGETIMCSHTTKCKQSSLPRFAKEKKSSAVKPAAKKKATKSSAQDKESKK